MSNQYTHIEDCDLEDHNVVDRHIDNRTYVSCLPDPAPFELLQSKIGRNGRTHPLAIADGVTDQKEYEAWYAAEAKRVYEAAVRNHALMATMSRKDRLAWIQGLVDQVMASDMPFYVDAYSAIYDCDLTWWALTEWDGVSVLNWTERTYYVAGFGRIKLEGYGFESGSDWAWSLFNHMGIKFKRHGEAAAIQPISNQHTQNYGLLEAAGVPEGPGEEDGPWAEGWEERSNPPGTGESPRTTNLTELKETL